MISIIGQLTSKGKDFHMFQFAFDKMHKGVGIM